MPNINDFKSKLKGGGARANQFRVVMPFPGFAQLGGETETMSFLCHSTSLPGMTIAEVPVPFRGRELYVAGDRTFATWATTILNDNDFKIRRPSEKDIVIEGELFDAEPLLKSLYKTDDKKTLSKDFNSGIKVNLL